MTRRIIYVAVAALLVLSAVAFAADGAGEGTKCGKKVKKAAAQCKTAEFSGCKSEKACAGKCSSTCCADAKRAAHTSAVKKVVDNIPYREAKRLVVTGEVMCGKCAKIGEMVKCQPMVKTNDGKIYPLVKNGVVKKLRACHSDSQYKISGRVKKIQGVRYLDVTSVKVM